MATHISGTAQKYFVRDIKGKLCSKFGEDRSKTGLTMLAVVAVWTDTGRMDGHRMDGRTDAKANLFSVQCCRLHWADNRMWIMKATLGCKTKIYLIKQCRCEF